MIEDMQIPIVELKIDIQELVIKNMQRQIAELTYQLAEVMTLEDHEKNDQKSMVNFENMFQRHEQRKQLFDQDEYDIKTKSFDDSSSFVDLNQPPKLDEDRKDDAEGEDLDPKFLICDVRANGIKLDVVLEVIFFIKHVAKDIPHICLRKILELMRS